MPLVASAAANLPDGRILTWSAYAKLKFHYGDVGIGKTYTSVFDPKTNRSSDGLVSNTEHDMFCPGTALLEDGRVMVTGGSSDQQTSIYDPVSSAWSKGPKMNTPRAYHSMTPLADGSIFTLGGSWDLILTPAHPDRVIKMVRFGSKTLAGQTSLILKPINSQLMIKKGFTVVITTCGCSPHRMV